MNRLQYLYTRERRNFGRQCLFSDRNQLLFSEIPHRSYLQEYILRNPVDRSTQISSQMGFSEMNTENVQLISRGINHCEGGWPKEVNYHDEEQVIRYRKKIERDENWGQQVLELTKPVLHAIKQNNAVNIYQKYFEDVPPLPTTLSNSIKIVNIFRDQCLPTRPITHISWSPNGFDRMLTTHTHISFNPNLTHENDCYIWDVENTNTPIGTLKPPVPAISTEWNTRDERLIGSGLKSGLIAIYDPRADGLPQLFTEQEVSHRESVTSFHWIHSKSNNEFFSGSLDGSIHFWDVRQLREPINTILMDVEKTDDQIRSRSHGCSILEFEYTIPTRFMVGSDKGRIFIGNRKGLTPSEIWLSNYQVMSGPIHIIQRNPTYLKNFLIVGDWCAKIYNEDCKDFPLLRTDNHLKQLNCGEWSCTKCSLFFLGRSDGVVEFWDLLQEQNEPIIAMKISNNPILALKCSEDGDYLAVGTGNGDIFMLGLDEGLIYNLPNDKSLLASIFDRETRRDKLLEGRLREINLKLAQEEKQRQLDEAAKDLNNDENMKMDDNEDIEEIENEAEEEEEEGSENLDEQEQGIPEEEIEIEKLSEREIFMVKNLFIQVTDDEKLKRKSKNFPEIATAFDSVAGLFESDLESNDSNLNVDEVVDEVIDEVVD